MPPSPFADLRTFLGERIFGAIHMSPYIIGGAFFLILFVWGVYSWVLFYHWRKFGVSALEVMKMSVIYFAGSGILIALLCLSFAAYSLSAT